jgi:hypothetical protein
VFLLNGFVLPELGPFLFSFYGAAWYNIKELGA